MIFEAQVHHELRNLLRSHISSRGWLHHLTVARMTARAIRLRRSVTVQTAAIADRYCWSYLSPAILSQTPVRIVVPEPRRTHLRNVEIPFLCEQFGVTSQYLHWSDPLSWVGSRLAGDLLPGDDWTTIIDGAEDLADWAQTLLTRTLDAQAWSQQYETTPDQTAVLSNFRVQLAQHLWQRPNNPYNAYSLGPSMVEMLTQTLSQLAESPGGLAPSWQSFQTVWRRPDAMLWATLNRTEGRFELKVSPVSFAQNFKSLWQKQPVVLMGSYLTGQQNASWRQQFGLDERFLSLEFSCDRQNEVLTLYTPERIPLPNTPEFQPWLFAELIRLLALALKQEVQPIVVLVGDLPLKNQVGAVLASYFGSQVKVERPLGDGSQIMVCDWAYWRKVQTQPPVPKVLVMATLPFPSLENPLVKERVSIYKAQRQDWFRRYLLPTALKTMQRAILPLRRAQGTVALLDSRVAQRSYGTAIFEALSPCDRINYLDTHWFGSPRLPSP
ncbi:MAG: helicase C-terminal domain-containing protein [Cyanobacteria bacterium P01_H01_bin.15]